MYTRRTYDDTAPAAYPTAVATRHIPYTRIAFDVGNSALPFASSLSSHHLPPLQYIIDINSAHLLVIVRDSRSYKSHHLHRDKSCEL
jgi:hypothetical protein